MLPVGLVYSSSFEAHNPGLIRVEGNNLYHEVEGQNYLDQFYTMDRIKYPYTYQNPTHHPERSNRATAAYNALVNSGLAQRMLLYEPSSANLEDLIEAHAMSYIEQVQLVSQKDRFLAEATYLNRESYQTGLLSAGAALSVSADLLNGVLDSALCLSRPPGHHAGRKNAGGFCLFNNAAIAAKHFLKQFGIERVMILDWDLHHGDGTQNIVKDDPRILFCSLHQFGPELYPESGDFHETGNYGNIINLPLPAKITDNEYLAVFKRIVPIIVAQWCPQIIIVSAGFDGHFNDINHLYLYDPGAGFNLTPQLYHTLTDIVGRAAQTIGAKYLVLLEGGYDLGNLGNSVSNVVAAMLHLPPVVRQALPPELECYEGFELESYITELNNYHLGKWKF
ncbi:MAG: histone deacetylase [Chloroflexi bacterium]|uniref:Histone deacetylase n=1 Tax=Candidatus Chlorohelix allophototropha TaxID=3003348 RepID=A0A8T7M376_9CHLR|nr:histone deacetylase [Chloroflexota bacterium]WJW67349.1 histone deacetylase [Chloroflexota bacterium L227-S17]